MKTKMLTIAAILVTAAALTSMVSATPMAVYADKDYNDEDHDEDERDYDKDHDDNEKYNGDGDSSETNTEQKLKQENVGSGESTNFNCGQNLINSPRVEQECEAEEEVSDGDGDGNGDGDGRFITICHATGSATNPFNEIRIPISAIPAHLEHQEGEDIIPAPAGGCPTATTIS
jgi:hypothetical protein